VVRPAAKVRADDGKVIHHEEAGRSHEDHEEEFFWRCAPAVI
jgi:hypothetical protein